MHSTFATIKKLIKSKNCKEILQNYNTDMLQIVCAAILMIFALLPLGAVIIGYYIGVIDVTELVEGYYKMYLSFLPLVFVLFLLNTIVLFAKCKKELVTAYRLPWILLILWIFLSTLANGNYERLYMGRLVFDSGIMYGNSFILYFVYFIVCFFTASFVLKDSIRRLVFRTLFIVSDVLSFIVMAYQVGILPRANLPSHVLGQFASVFCNNNHCAYFLTIVIVLSGTLLATETFTKWSAFYALTYVFNTVILVFNDTFGCYLAVCASLIFLIIVKWIIDHKLCVKGIVVFVVFIVVSAIVNAITGGVTTDFVQMFMDLVNIVKGTKDADSAGSGRWQLWTTTISYMNEKPSSYIFGLGIEGYALRMTKAIGNGKVHNEFLEILSFFGIPGLAFYLTGIMKVFVHGLKQKNNLTIAMIAAISAAFGYLFSSFFGVSMFYTTPFLLILLGLSYTTPQEGEAFRLRFDGESCEMKS